MEQNARRNALIAEIATNTFTQNPNMRTDQVIDSVKEFLTKMDNAGLSQYIPVKDLPIIEPEHVCEASIHILINIRDMEIGTLPHFEPFECKSLPISLGKYISYSGEIDDGILQFAFCAECGKINGHFPVDMEELKEEIKTLKENN